MDAMVLQVEPVPLSAVREYGPWPFCHPHPADLGRRELDKSAVPARAGLNPGLVRDGPGQPAVPCSGTTPERGHPRPPPPPTILTTPARSYGLSQPLNPSGQTTSRLSGGPSVKAAGLCLDLVTLPVQGFYDISGERRSPRPQLSAKRRRPASDVDGPLTASQGCKKRRLRREMVTSRLSRPFSEPATHIIDREAASMGDKHLFKLAAALTARWTGTSVSTWPPKLNHPSPSTLLRRAAVINRFRLRVKSRAMERGDNDGLGLAADPALSEQQNHGVGHVVGAHFPGIAPSVPPVTGSGSPSLRGSLQRVFPIQLSLSAGEARAQSMSPWLRTTTGASGLRLPFSPRTRASEVKSGQLPHPAELDELQGEDEAADDQEVAFPTSEHESRYESTDEPDDVYADFGMIFGHGDAADEPEEKGGDPLEDYMDEMDGIPWTVR